MTTKELAVKQNSEPQEISGVNPEALIMAAIEKGVSIDVMERLLAMRERIQKDMAEKAFREAMASFQAECPVIVKSATVDYSSGGSNVNYQYAPLDTIVAAVREILGKNGLSYTFTTEQSDKSVTAICHVHHVLGHTESTAFAVPVDQGNRMNAAQKTASALTYAKRYSFCNGFGILTGDKDDDANSLNENGKKTVTSPNPAQKPAPAQTPPAQPTGPLAEYKRDVESAIKQHRTSDLMRLMNSARATLGGHDFSELARHVNRLTKKGA